MKVASIPLRASRKKTVYPAFLPTVRRTLVAPGLPLPTSKIQIPCALAIQKPNGNAPKIYPMHKATNIHFLVRKNALCVDVNRHMVRFYSRNVNEKRGACCCFEPLWQRGCMYMVPERPPCTRAEIFSHQILNLKLLCGKCFLHHFFL